MVHEVWVLDNTVYRKCPMALNKCLKPSLLPRGVHNMCCRVHVSALLNLNQSQETISAFTCVCLTPGGREAIIVECLAQGHKSVMSGIQTQTRMTEQSGVESDAVKPLYDTPKLFFSSSCLLKVLLQLRYLFF